MPDPILSDIIDDTVFPGTLGDGGQGGPTFSTGILETFAGSEQRCQNWLDPLLKWNVSYGVKNKTDFATLLAFFRARGGRSRGFLFLDPLDNQAYGQFIGTGNGSQQVFQLMRHYVTNRVQSRPITRPMSGSVVVYLNNVVATGYTYDHTTGLVSFTTAPAAGVSITADFQFYTPMRFDTDSMAGSLEGGTKTGWDSIPLVEVRERCAVLLPASPAPVVSTFPDVISRQMGGPKYGTQVAKSNGGWEDRAPDWVMGRLRWEIEEAVLSWADAQNLLYWFRTHAGRGKTFNWQDWTDYQATSEPMVGSGTQWQIVKRYTDGPVTIIRNITQPNTDTLVIVDNNGNPVGGYTINTSGLVTFGTAPTFTPAATCQFTVPVRFDTDELQMRHVEGRQWTVEGLSVIEVNPVPPSQEGGV